MADREALLMNSDDDEGLGFGEEGPEARNRLRHPVVAFFHVFFRAAALVVYIFCGFFGAGFISSFVAILILLSLDFWTVKNITGRILVGLRWWNYVDDDGVSHWVFESRKGVRAGGRPREKRIFWTALFVTPGIWLLLFFSSFVLLRLQWAILVLLALVLNGANLYGYIRCTLGHKPGLADATGILHESLSTMLIRRATASTDSATNSFTQQV